jgi:hypothetical protein
MLLLCLPAGCKVQQPMAGDEIGPAELLEQAGGKLQKEPIASNDFAISVVGIDFSGIPAGDAELAPAAKLPYLRTIVLRGTKVTDAGLAAFRDCQHLETLDLSHTDVLGTGLGDLRFDPIKELDLADSNLGDRGMASLVEAGRHLLRLNLAGTKISDEGLESLKNLHVLESIDLGRTRISGAGLRYLSPGLKQLGLSGTSLRNGGLTDLEQMSLLESLDLSASNVTDDAIPYIEAMVEAQCTKATRRTFVSLDLRKTAVSDAAIARLRQAVPGLAVQR